MGGSVRCSPSTQITSTVDKIEHNSWVTSPILGRYMKFELGAKIYTTIKSSKL